MCETGKSEDRQVAIQRALGSGQPLTILVDGGEVQKLWITREALGTYTWGDIQQLIAQCGIENARPVVEIPLSVPFDEINEKYEIAPGLHRQDFSHPLVVFHMRKK